MSRNPWLCIVGRRPRIVDEPQDEPFSLEDIGVVFPCAFVVRNSLESLSALPGFSEGLARSHNQPLLVPARPRSVIFGSIRG
jgi:hypothetical protein